MSETAKRLADKYITRDGSKLGAHTERKMLTRAAVFAAQARLAEISGGKSPIKDGDMHSILLAAVKASPELFNAT